jgi:malate dehydrogenase (oxaloacetate-decarboxylating)
MAAAHGIASIVSDRELREDYIIPSPFDRGVAVAVAAAVSEQAQREGTADAQGDEIGYAPGDTAEFRSLGA